MLPGQRRESEGRNGGSPGQRLCGDNTARVAGGRGRTCVQRRQLGRQGDISESDEFDITNYKRFDASERLGMAIATAFETFVLLLGKLNLGLGVTYGFASLKLAGRSSGEVKASDAPVFSPALVALLQSCRGAPTNARLDGTNLSFEPSL